MKITVLVEGKTEQAFEEQVGKSNAQSRFLPLPRSNLQRGQAPEDGRRTPAKGRVPSDAVIALTDVYTGTNEFVDAADAKRKMQTWVGNNEKFHPHAAQHDFEAWLLPFWTDIQSLAGHRRGAPPGPPEAINHNRPPSYHIREIFKIGARREAYSKARDATRILRGKDLTEAANQCPELKSFPNTILSLSGAAPL